MANHWLIGLALGMVIVTGAPGQEKGKSETGAPQVKREDLSTLTYNLVRDNKVEGDELKKLQVYLSKTLVLYRQVTDLGVATEKSSGVRVEISVSFEPDCAMVFSAGEGDFFMSGWSYCGQQYQPISNLNRISDGDVAKVIGTVTRDLRIDNSLVDARSGILGDFKSTGPAGTVRVVPGRTIGK